MGEREGGSCITHTGFLFGGGRANNNSTEITLCSDIMKERVILWKYIISEDYISNPTII